ncbi:undecaprenyldiphospho-muramoylpentapeptide beta-N-acetylglucosaminyltransferase [Entomomonas asaccharolytica]|uniref:UDP-N-acetylglucosamine--N-acetylmuramyl-(pentapeptide) pyrophosphoryl-undecaprenol N-acetylglucosamine transferase n=1 Tax=Entomomonas asaccharolytica TaxID=2785331 RepID=A0A974NEG5_9GAMM|nr:undecaprenyldiphospho-muramoylpentapeptide beta-N-acetylglucosaminyltransferase [Entomomonas asaccharolytica]QQP84972.1 undecaprenyldiphospho-muramoylpentapeptide beta-N-acetylglucosaminyltransferase [Entomomonas asaccharolytica]
MVANNVLIMAAGTGGHVFPALACAKEFQERGYNVHWLGIPKGMENELVAKAGLSMHHIHVTGIRGKSLTTLIKAPFLLLGALLQARKLIKEIKPVCVVGFGGFVTGPGGLAAKLACIPLIIHEQNAKVGTANRYLAKMAARICQAFPNTFVNKEHLITTGNPVRKELFIEQVKESIVGRKVRLLVVGGSLGAEPLNKLLPDALAFLDESIRPEVFHQAGKKHADITKERYQKVAVQAKVEPFITDMQQAYQWADLVVCRAGALTVSELAATGSAAVLIPLPHAIDDHQSFNADYLACRGAAIKLIQAQLTPQVMADHLQALLKNPEKLIEMGKIAKSLAKPKATSDVVDTCLEVANG